MNVRELYWREICASIWTTSNPLCTITIVHGIEGFVVAMNNQLAMEKTLEAAKTHAQKMFADMVQQLIE